MGKWSKKQSKPIPRTMGEYFGDWRKLHEATKLIKPGQMMVLIKGTLHYGTPQEIAIKRRAMK